MLKEQETYLPADRYLAMELHSPVRHEYFAGQIYAMTGVTRRHNTIAGNLYIALRPHLRGKPCDVFLGEVKLHIARAEAYYYPDLMVTCNEVGQAVCDTAHVVDDARLVIEILSPSTEGIDRREKAHNYRLLPGLREYALVSQDRQRVEIHRRQGDIGWLRIEYAPGDNVEFDSIGLTLPLATVYEGTDTPETPPQEI